MKGKAGNSSLFLYSMKDKSIKKLYSDGENRDCQLFEFKGDLCVIFSHSDVSESKYTSRDTLYILNISKNKITKFKANLDNKRNFNPSVYFDGKFYIISWIAGDKNYNIYVTKTKDFQIFSDTITVFPENTILYYPRIIKNADIYYLFFQYNDGIYVSTSKGLFKWSIPKSLHKRSTKEGYPRISKDLLFYHSPMYIWYGKIDFSKLAFSKEPKKIEFPEDKNVLVVNKQYQYPAPVYWNGKIYLFFSNKIRGRWLTALTQFPLQPDP